MVRISDVVSRNSYQNDLLFRVAAIEWENRRVKRVLLKGLDLRLVADAPLSDLRIEDKTKVNEYERDSFARGEDQVNKVAKEKIQAFFNGKRALPSAKEEELKFKMTPKILHLDGDPDYLKICLENYEKLELKAVGIAVPEYRQPKVIHKLLEEYRPDILVLTGHDNMAKNIGNFNDLRNYTNSGYFIEAVKNARSFEPDLDRLVIFAGACQSYFEGLMQAGANFASSPYRIFIHALDPLLVVEHISYTPVDQMANTIDIISTTITGIRGIGGVQTKGKLRTGLPKSPFVGNKL